MRIRNWAIASIAIMAMAMPARADLVLLFLDSPTQVINDFISFGVSPYANPSGTGPDPVPAVSALNNPLANPGNLAAQSGTISIPQNGTRIIQVALFDSLVGSTFPPLNAGGPPASSIPAQGVYTNPRWLSSATGTANIPQMFGLTLQETRIQGSANAFVAPPPAVIGVDPDTGNNRTHLVNPNMAFVNAGSMPAPPTYFMDFGGLLATGNGAIPNRDYLNDANAPALGGRMALFNMEITAGPNVGLFPAAIKLIDRSGFNDFEVRATGAGGVGAPGDRIALDSTIFSANHLEYWLNVNVTPIPEPSSMALAGMALAGLGYKLRRKMKAKTQVAA